MMHMRPSVLIVSLSVLFGLAGCGSGGLDDVKDWMKGVREQTKVAVPKLSEPKKFSPFTYAVKDSPDPFNASKLAVALAKQRASSGSSSIKPPDLERRREPLEYFPLDTIKMVGTLQKSRCQSCFTAGRQNRLSSQSRKLRRSKFRHDH